MSKPAVVFGGPSPEHDISVSTGLQATHTLADAGDVHAVYWDKDRRFWLVDPAAEPGDFVSGAPRRARELTFVAEPGGGLVARKRPLDVSAVLVCCHGGPGEDGTLQGAFDLVGYRYTGSGRAASSVCIDKLVFSATVAAAGLPVLPRRLLGPPRSEPGLEAPFIVKPRFGGSSIGIEVVDDLATAHALLGSSPHLGEGAVVEPYIAGVRDLQVAVRTFPAVELSAVEEPLRAPGGLYTYEQKYLAWGEGGAVARRLPADLGPGLAERIGELARALVDILDLRSIARIDFLERDGEIWVNEVNTVPGSQAAYLWIDPPLTRSRLLADMLAEAENRPLRAFPTAGADGTALRNAGTIASKLG